MTPVDIAMFPFNNPKRNEHSRESPSEQENGQQSRLPRPNIGPRRHRPKSEGNLLLSERVSKEYYARTRSALNLLGPRQTSTESSVSGLSSQGLLNPNDGAHSPHSMPIGSYRGATYAVVTTPNASHNASTESVNIVTESTT